MKVIIFIMIISINLKAKEFDLSRLHNHAINNSPKGKILNSEVKEIEYGLKRIKSDYLPKLSAIVGGEKRQGASRDPINTERFVAEMRLKYNLFKFGQTNDSLEALEKVYNQKKNSFEWWKINILRKLKVHYFTAISFKSKIDFLKKELSYNLVLSRKVGKRKKSGLIGNSDSLDIELRRSDILTQINFFEEKLNHSLDKLKKLSYLNYKDKILLPIDLPHTHFNLDLEELITESEKKNKELRNSSLAEKEYLSKLNMKNKNKLPEVNLVGRFGKMRIDEQYSTNSTEGLLGLYIEMPLFDGGQKKSIQQIYNEKYQQKVLESKLLKNNNTIEISHKHELLNKTHERLDLLEKGYDRGLVYFKNVLDEYDRGIKNSIDLVSARERLVKINMDRIDSKKDYLMTVLELEELTGKQL